VIDDITEPDFPILPGEIGKDIKQGRLLSSLLFSLCGNDDGGSNG